MITRIILWASIIWLAPLICLMLKNETKFKKNIAIGVTFPYEGREDEEVKSRLNRFKKQILWVCALLIFAAIPGMFVPSIGLSMSIWFIWIILCIIVPYIPYVMCNRDLKKIKQERGWSRAGSESITIDTSSIPTYRWISPWLFVVPLIISLLPLAWDQSLWFLYTIDALCIILFWICYRYLYRNKSEKVDNNQELTKTLTQVRRHNWGIVWIISSYSMAALNFGIMITREHPIPMMIVIFAISFIMVFALLRVEMNTRKVQEKLTSHSGYDYYVDDDDKWIWGIFYYNPKDSHNIVNDRVGINSSFNLAKPMGKVSMGLVIVILLFMPFMSLIIEKTANKPITLEMTDTAIISRSGRTEYTVLISDVKKVELMESLPGNMIRTNGTGMENLLKGRFSAKSVGKMFVCLDPTSKPFILLTTGDDQHYLFGTRDAEKTKSIYEELINVLGLK